MSRDLKECQRTQLALDSIGMRQRGTAVGLLQLCKELLDAGVLTQDAVVRIREAIVEDVALNCPRTQPIAEYQNMVRARLDTIMALPKGVPAMTAKDAATPH